MRKSLLTMAAPLVLCAVTAAQAATLTALTSASAGTEQDIGSINNLQGLQSSGSAAVSDIVQFSTGSVTSSGGNSYSIDATTGELRFNLGASRSGVPCSPQVVTGCGGGAGASAVLGVMEQFTVSGTGTLTALMQVDADWFSPDHYGFLANIVLSVGGAATNDLVSFSTVDDPGATGVSQLLSVSQTVTNAVNLTSFLSTQLQGNIAANGRTGARIGAFMDASNTATFTLQTTGNLTLNFSDPGYLSNPAFGSSSGGGGGGGGSVTPSPVPLPASLPLLFVGLAGLRMAKRRG